MKMNSLQKFTRRGKLCLVLLVLMALLAPARMMGQQQSLKVCESNSSTGITTVPAYCYYQNRLSESQFIYPDDMLGNMAGSNIEAIIFKEGSSFDNLSLGGEYEVYMCVVDYTEFTDPPVLDWSGKTKVYTGPLTFNKSGQWYYWRIDLDVPYYYQGGNLLVGVKQTQLHEAKSVVWHGVFYEYPDLKYTAIAKGSSATPQLQNFLPEATFIYRSASSVITTPQGMTATVTGGHTASVSWEGNSNNSWQLVCSDEPLTTAVLYGESLPQNTITIGNTSYDFEGLDLGTTYYVYVRGVNGTDYSLWSGVSFTTEDYYCEISYLLEDKDDDGWTGNAINVVDENDEVLATWTIEDGNSMEGTLLLQDEKNCRFVWVSGGEHSYPNECSFTIYGSDGLVIVSVTAPNAGNLADGETIATYTMNCSAPHVPVNLSVNNITMTSATVTWEPGGEETEWNVRFGNPDDWTTIEGIEETTYTMESLTSGTIYQVQVQAVVDGALSQWVGKEFNTSFCAPAEQCNITYTIGVSNTQYGVRWDGDVLQVVHANTNIVVGEITLEENGPTSGEIGLCDGEDYNLVWVRNVGFPYASFTIIGPDGWVIATASNSPNAGTIASFTMDCDACMVPANLVVDNLATTSATVSWEPGSEEEAWIVNYKDAAATGEETIMSLWEGSLPDGWTAMAIVDGSLVVTTDWIPSEGNLVSNQPSFLLIPIQLGGQAEITVQGSDEEGVFAGVYSGSLEGITLPALVSGIQEQVELSGESQSFDVNLSGEGSGYLFLFHASGQIPVNLYLKQLVVYGPAAWSEDILVTGTPSCAISGLTAGATYNVRVKAVCGQNDYSNPSLVSFTTPLCSPEDQCSITYILRDSFGDGWKGYDGDPNSAINVVNVATGAILATLTFDNGLSYEGALPLCPGEYDFVWVSGSYDEECSFTIYDPYETIILTHSIEETTPEAGSLLQNPYQHTCPAPYVFITAGNWCDVDNWDQGELPGLFDNVIINAAATIPSGCLAEADIINIGTGGSLTIEDGGQLKHKNTGVVATVEKEIVGYTVLMGTQTENTDGWYLIASPLAASVSPANVTNMISQTPSEYDLFMFNTTEAAVGSEWQNYKQNHFSSLEPMVGYLYANANETTLQFTGELLPFKIDPPTSEDEVITLYQGDGSYANWNLVGNPHVYPVYPINGRLRAPKSGDLEWIDYTSMPYYRMNEDNTGLEAFDDGAIFPGEGVFMEYDDYYPPYVYLSYAPYSGGGGGGPKGGFTLNLTKNSTTRDGASTGSATSTIDRAIVRFGEGPTLGKLMLNPDNTNICIPQGTEDYAIVRSAYEGEVPVNFKADKNGTYTLSANVNDAEMEYLHLVDNLTGADVDLLESSAYTYNAKTTDYASRFKLVFKAKENGASTGSATFAFFNGSSWTVSNLGEATLQVIDAMGRILSSETINGNAEANIQAAPGVYMLRLVNGDHVKVQKIIIK